MNPQDAIWQDVFLTKPDEDAAAPHRKLVFVAPVMSVSISENDGIISSSPKTGGSDWLALSFPADAGTDEIAAWESVIVGDTISVGSAAHGGGTDFMTVLETADVDRLANSSLSDWHISTEQAEPILKRYPTGAGGIALGNFPIGVDPPTPTHLKPLGAGSILAASFIKSASLPGAKRCIRVNRSIDATTMPGAVPDDARGLTRVYSATLGSRERLFFPCYRTAVETDPVWRVNSKPMRLQLPSNVKQLHGVKLMGYSLNNSVGTENQHEYKEHDWLALRIKELHLSNSVISNNLHANGALHVIRGTSDVYEPLGLTCVRFSPVNLSGLTVELVDYNGADAQFSRVHIWLRILVTSC